MSLYDNKLAVEDGDDTYLITRSSPGTNWMNETERNAASGNIRLILPAVLNATMHLCLAIPRKMVFKFTGFDRYSFRSNVTTDYTEMIGD